MRYNFIERVLTRPNRMVTYRDVGILNFITGEKLEEAFERHINELSNKRKAVSPEGNTA